MKPRLRSIFNIFTLLTLLSMLIGILPASPVQAEALARPLQTSGDFVLAKSMGGTNSESGDNVAVDSSGNIYTAGYFYGTADFDPGAGIFNLTSAGAADIFVSKLDSSGNFLWSKRLGGISQDIVNDIALDSSGSVYLTGHFYGTADFDPSESTANLTSAGVSDIFISKLDSNGNFVWAKSMGGTGYEQGNSIALDSSGNIYTTGYYNKTVDFDPGAGTANLTSVGGGDVVVSKLDSNGNFIWAESMGGIGFDQGHNIAVDTSGNIYFSGTFELTADFDPSANTSNLTSVGDYDIFVSQLDSNGNFIWAKSMGGIDSDTVLNSAVDSNGNIYTTGYFSGTADFNPSLGGIDNLVSAGLSDVFISKLDSNGNFVWAKRMGGTDYEEGSGITLDSSGNIYTTGYFSGNADFDPGLGFTNLVSAGAASDIFVSKLDSNGNFVFAKSMGGTSYDYGKEIALDPSGNIYTTGNFQETADFNPSGVIANLTSVGDIDIFVSKLEHGDVAPVVLGITRANANPTSAASVDFTLAFSEPVTGVDPSDFSLTTTGSISSAAVTGSSGNGNTYTITVDTGNGSGTIRLNLVDDDTIIDSTFNPLGGVGAGNGNFTAGERYSVPYNLFLPLILR